MTETLGGGGGGSNSMHPINWEKGAQMEKIFSALLIGVQPAIRDNYRTIYCSSSLHDVFEQTQLPANLSERWGLI